MQASGGQFINASGASVADVILGNGGQFTNMAGGTILNSVLLSGGGLLVNGTGDTVSGIGYGVSISGGTAGSAGTIINAGTLNDLHPPGGGGDGVEATGLAADVTNQSGGLIVDAVAGIYAGTGASPGTVVNTGSIVALNTAGGYAVELRSGGVVTNQTGGFISGSRDGVRIANAGGTVTNAATVTGGTYAVQLATGFTDRLVIDPGAVFSGTVSGGNTLGATAVSTLELASGATAGTLSGLGTKYIDFAQITIDAGATWTLASGNVPAGSTITDLGTLINEGAMSAPITVTAGGLLP